MSQERTVRGKPNQVLPRGSHSHRTAGRKVGAECTAGQVEAIEEMGREALLALWAATLGGEPPARLSQPFLRRILTWELQAIERGGLSAAVKRKLESLAATQASGNERSPATPKMRTGGRLLREWNGVTHVVDVVESGFLWRGERHRSLSAIARAITGAHWSGPRFFGLQESAGAPGAKKTTTRRTPKVVRTSDGMSSTRRTRRAA